MDDQPSQVFQDPPGLGEKKSAPSKRIWIIAAVAVVLAAIIIGGGMYVVVKGIVVEPPPIPTATATPTSTPTPTPDETAGWKTFQNETFEFKFQYPQTFVQYSPGKSLLSSQTDYFKKHEGIITTVAYPQNAFRGTNFVHGYVTAAVSRTIANPSECQEFMDTQGAVKKLSKSKTINGSVFSYDSIGGAAAGLLSEVRIYHAFHTKSATK